MEFGADVMDALERAAHHLPGRDPGSHLFFERRFERRLELGPDGVASATAARVQGLAAETPGTSVFRSVPHLEALEDLATAAARGAVGEPAEPDPRAEGPGPELPQAALEALRSRAGGGARLQYVQVDQQVAVARRDGRVGQDRRRGRRLRLAVGDAVVERAFRGETLDLEGVAEQVLARAAARARPLPAWPGRTVAVFAPGTGGVLFHELIGHALEGDVQARRASKLARAEGPVAPAGVTVVDDPRQGRVSWRMDDEGTTARPVVLLREGRAAELLASGHVRRASFAEPAMPRMGATFLNPGPLHPDEVPLGVARGLYVRRMESAATDPTEGTATFHVTDADMLIAGRIEVALEPFLMHIAMEDLVTLDRIADDLAFDACVGVCVREGQALASTVGAPTFRLGLVTVKG
ncbi:MAG TPA: metallopeptidase TldD-related protein [Candidatus Polarisedimenticolaceae bacterium]|nr:metallopeptidase TldD-related protein [Candidatus Polarisedimenticolaceae bacterium]